MSETPTLRPESERLDALLHELDAHPDPTVPRRLREVVELLLALHTAGLERVLALAGDPGLGSPALTSRIADDPVVGPLLLVHGLHPYGVETRVARALDRLRPRVAAQGCRAALEQIGGGGIRLRVEGAGRLGPAAWEDLRRLIETTLLDIAPEVSEVLIVAAPGGPAAPASSPLIQITRTPKPAPAVPEP